MRVVLELSASTASMPPVTESSHSTNSASVTEERAIALPSHMPVADAIELALGLSDDDSTVILRVAGHRSLRGESATAYDAACARSADLEDLALERLLEEAQAEREAGNLETARSTLERALRILQSRGSAEPAQVLLDLAGIERTLGHSEKSAEYLDRALARVPYDYQTLEARVSIALETAEPLLAAALRLRLAAQQETSAKRVETLLRVADDSLNVARDTLGYASDLIPDSLHLLHRLRAVNEAVGNYEAALAVAVRLAELTQDPKQRAQALVDAARLCSERVHHTARAVALYEAAIEDDPEVPGAFDAVEAELLKAGDYAAAAQAYERQLERLVASASVSTQIDLLRKLSALQRDRLAEPALAVGTLERLIKLAPNDLEARVSLASVLLQIGESARATRALEAAVLLAPTRPDTYRALADLLHTAGDDDRSFSACSVLVALGEADLDEQLIHAQYRPDALPSPRSALDSDTFDQLLPDDHPAEFDHLARVLELAALEVWLDPASQAAAAVPPAKSRVDSAQTTVSAARCFFWAAKLLELPEPEVYLDPKVSRVGAQLLPQRNLGVLLGRPVLGGRTVGELVFLAVHHLTYARPGWRLASLCGTQDEVSHLLHAAVALARPDLPSFVAPRSRAAELSQRLAQYLDSAERQLIAEISTSLLGDDGKLDPMPWLRSIEQTACRAGLLACGDVTVAGPILAVAGSCPSGQSAAERARLLYPFCVSQRHAALRHWLGVAVPGRTSASRSSFPGQLAPSVAPGPRQ